MTYENLVYPILIGLSVSIITIFLNQKIHWRNENKKRDRLLEELLEVLILEIEKNFEYLKNEMNHSKENPRKTISHKPECGFNSPMNLITFAFQNFLHNSGLNIFDKNTQSEIYDYYTQIDIAKHLSRQYVIDAPLLHDDNLNVSTEVYRDFIINLITNDLHRLFSISEDIIQLLKKRLEEF